MTLWRCWGRFKMIFLEGLNEKLEELNGKGLGKLWITGRNHATMPL